MSKVLVFGAFDQLLAGHVSFLEQASKFGDELVVAVLGDGFFVKYRGLPPSWPLKKRMEAVRELPLRTTVYEEDVHENWRSLLKICPDVIVLSAAQAKWRHRLDDLLMEYNLQPRIEVLPATSGPTPASAPNDLDLSSKPGALP